MTVYLLAGGGTAGHVNPLLATADAIRATEPDATIIVVGTREGLESRLVPERGYELVTIAKLPFPRRPNRAALRFLPGMRNCIGQLASLIRERGVDVVIGFGGYASAPAYLAARGAGVPVVIHEANARPGLANRLGARFTPYVAVVFPGTPLRGAVVTGLPLRQEIAGLNQATAAREAVGEFGLDPDRPTVLVTGGSLGAQRINLSISAAVQSIIDSGYQVLHIWGDKKDFIDPGVEHYRVLRYCDRMELAFAAAAIAVARAGSATVAELSVLGIPSILVPYPVGNGEQRFNAADLVAAGGAILVEDDRFTPEYVRGEFVVLLGDAPRLARMRSAASGVGIPDGAERLVALIRNVVARA
jgi:UDP-N-acetylglucosamine--N-acetylmuramyl-(pentapeptide) pyrophosphoryl-undecaprenol N-acetylglucosamine transferase